MKRKLTILDQICLRAQKRHAIQYPINLFKGFIFTNGHQPLKLSEQFIRAKLFLHLQSKKWLEFFCPTSILLSLKVTRIVGLDMKDNKSDQFLHPRIQAGLLLFCSIVSISHHLDFKKVKKKIWKYIDLIEKSSNNFGAKGWLHQGMWVGICRLVVLWWGRGTQIYDFFLVYSRGTD